MGLGLTIVETSLRKWDGFVKVRSQPEHGSSFRLFLPKAVGQAPRKARQSKVGGETALVVDDDIKTRKVFASILREAGYKVHLAADAKQFLETYKKRFDEIDVAIVDLIMPDFDGKEVLNAILDINPTALVIMTSGFSRDYVRGYLERGSWGFAQKPVDSNQLLTTMRRLLDQQVARRQTPSVKSGDSS